MTYTDDRRLGALKKELREEAKSWAYNKALYPHFLGIAIFFAILMGVIAIMIHHLQPVQLAHEEISPKEIGLLYLLLTVGPIVTIFAYRRKKFLNSEGFRRLMFDSLKKRLAELHERRGQGMMMTIDKELLTTQIRVAELLYEEMTSSKYVHRHLDAVSPKPTGHIRQDYMEKRGSETLGIGGPCTPPQRVHGVNE